MSDLYSELLVAKKQSVIEKYGKILIIGATVLFGVAGILLHPLLFIFCLVGVGLGFYFFPRFKVEYEYLHVNGEFDIDKIFSKEMRKRVMSLELSKMEVLAPVSSHHLDSFNQMKNLKLYDFSSGESDRKVYAMIVTKGQSTFKVLLELDEKMLRDLKQQNPRKVFID